MNIVPFQAQRRDEMTYVKEGMTGELTERI